MRLRACQRLAVSLAAPVALALAAGALLAACGDKKDKAPTQAAAKVNKEEVTVHQINAALAQQRGLRPEQAEEAGRRILERLIDQELAVQKAAELRLDREPRVVQAIEAMRREIIARSYAEKIGESAAKPSAAEVRRYYDENPALFRERRIYQLQEFMVQATPAQVAALPNRLQAAKSPADATRLLSADGLKFARNQAVRAAEQVPLDRLGQLAQLKDGQLMVMPAPGGASVLFVLASRAQPIDEAGAAPAIEQFLHNDRKRKLAAQDIQALRATAKIEYVGKYVGSVPLVDAAAGPSVADAAASAAAALDANPAADGMVIKPRMPAASEADAAAIRKGLGLK